MYEDEELMEEKSFKVNDEDEDHGVFDDDLDIPLEPLDEPADLGFGSEEGPEAEL